MTNPSTDSPQSKKRAVVIIPAMRREEQFNRRDVLAKNLGTVEAFPLRRGPPVEVSGVSGLRLLAEPLRSADSEPGPDVDVFEAYWTDMIPEQTELGPWQRLVRGFDLLAYWLFSWRMWRALRVSRYITFGLMVGGVMLVLWYASLTLLVASAIGNDPTLKEKVKGVPVIESLLEGFLSVAEQVGDWRYWALIAFFLPILRVDALAQMAFFIKHYFENTPNEEEIGLRDRLRARVRSTLDQVLRADYDEVVIFAHSFGAVIATDVLADWPHAADFSKIRLFTVGSSVAVLQYRSKWLHDQCDRLLTLPALQKWQDFFSDTDWLCTAFPGQKDRYGDASSFKLNADAPLWQRLMGRTHMLYYRDSEVLAKLAEPLGETPK